MAHNLITNYGLDQHLDVLKPDRCTPHEMTRFHTDEYIDFLARVTPETFDEMTGHGSRCEFPMYLFVALAPEERADTRVRSSSGRRRLSTVRRSL